MDCVDEKFITMIWGSRSVTVLSLSEVDSLVWKPSSDGEVTAPVRRLQANLLVDIKVYVSRMINDLPWALEGKTITINKGVTTHLSPLSPTQQISSPFQSLAFEHPLKCLHLRIYLSWNAQLVPREQTHRSRLNQMFASQRNKKHNFSRLR